MNRVTKSRGKSDRVYCVLCTFVLSAAASAVAVVVAVAVVAVDGVLVVLARVVCVGPSLV